MALTPYKGPGFDSCKPNPFRPINEGQPSSLMSWHPALEDAVLASPSKAELGDFYRQFTGKEPSTLVEYLAKFRDEGREIPKYVQDYLDAHPELDTD